MNCVTWCKFLAQAPPYKVFKDGRKAINFTFLFPQFPTLYQVPAFMSSSSSPLPSLFDLSENDSFPVSPVSAEDWRAAVDAGLDACDFDTFDSDSDSDGSLLIGGPVYNWSGGSVSAVSSDSLGSLLSAFGQALAYDSDTMTASSMPRTASTSAVKQTFLEATLPPLKRSKTFYTALATCPLPTSRHSYVAMKACPPQDKAFRRPGPYATKAYPCAIVE